MAEKPKPSVADYLIPAISPALIVGLVGSLVFFLVEILYAGKYEGRLLWTLFFFVGGMVLVARISIQVDASRAAFYGLGLAVVSWIALFAFIEYPADSKMSNFAGLINFILMAIVWWCAHKLTWDCTHIDEKREASGKGLLAAAGFEKRPDTEGQIRDADVRFDEVEEPTKKPSLLKRWQKFRQRRKKRPHTPGLTVVWFSLAALPIFGLGQSLIPGGDSARRSFTFWLAACYIGCALGLLLTTSFLGIRRYLRQRKLQMPKAMTGMWLGMGAALVLGFLVVGALIPRPYSETPIWGLNRIGSPDRNSSKNALLKDSAGKGEGKGGNQTSPGDGQNTGKKGDPGGKGKDGDAKEGSGEKKDGKGGDGDKKDGNGKDGNGKDGDERGKESSKSSDRQSDDKGEQSKTKDGSSSDPDRRFPDTKLGNVLEKVVTFLKWVVFALIALIVLAFLFRGLLKYLSNFMPWAKNWLAAISAWWDRLWRKRGERGTEEKQEAKKPVRRTFASFSNPFNDNTSNGRSVEELIQYTFAALEAWAGDRNHGRSPDETALEFASRLSNTFHSLEGEAQKLAILVVRLAYANGTLPKDARKSLESVWDHLTSAMPAPAEVE